MQNRNKEETVGEITYRLDMLCLLSKLSKNALVHKVKYIDYDLIFDEIEKHCQNISVFMEDLKEQTQNEFG